MLLTYDEIVYQALQMATSGRALERLFKDKTGKHTTDFFPDYLRLMAEKETKYNDYVYETKDG